jgi:hypothetical protein
MVMVYKSWCCKRKDILKSAPRFGFKEINEGDVQQPLQSHLEPLRIEELMVLEQERVAEEEFEETLPPQPKELSTKEILAIFSVLVKGVENVK